MCVRVLTIIINNRVDHITFLPQPMQKKWATTQEILERLWAVLEDMFRLTTMHPRVFRRRGWKCCPRAQQRGIHQQPWFMRQVTSWLTTPTRAAKSRTTATTAILTHLLLIQT